MSNSTPFHPYIENLSPVFEETEKKYGLQSGLLKAVAQQETGWSRRTTNLSALKSPVGAKGLMQFMPATAKRFGIDPRIPEQAIDGAGRYFKYLSEKFNGDLPDMLSAYNAGEGTVLDYKNGTNKTGKNKRRRKGILVPFMETIKYRERILARMNFEPTIDQRLTDLNTEQNGGGLAEAFSTVTGMSDYTSTKGAVKKAQQVFKQGDIVAPKNIDKAIIAPTVTKSFEPTELEDAFSDLTGMSDYTSIKVAEKMARQDFKQGDIVAPENIDKAIIAPTVTKSLYFNLLGMLENSIARNESDDADWQKHLWNEGSTKINSDLKYAAGIPEEDDRYSDMYVDLLNTKNSLEYDVKLRSMINVAKAERLLQDSKGVSNVASNIMAFVEHFGKDGSPQYKDVLFSDFVSELIGSMADPLFLVGGLETKIAAAGAPGVFKVAANVLEGAASNRIIEETSPLGTSEERLKEATVSGAVIGGTLGAGSELLSLGLKKASAFKDASVEKLVKEMEKLSPEASNMTPEEIQMKAKEATVDLRQWSQSASKIRDMEDIINSDMDSDIKTKALLDVYETLSPDDKALVYKDIEGNKDVEGLKNAIEENNRKKILEENGVEVTESTVGAKQVEGTGLLTDERTRALSMRTNAKEIIAGIDEKSQTVLDYLGMDKEKIVSTELLASVNPVQWFRYTPAVFSAEQHYLFLKTKKEPSEIAGFLRAISLAIYGESTGVLKGKDAEPLSVPTKGIIQKVSNDFNELYSEPLRANASAKLNAYVSEIQKTTGKSLSYDELMQDVNKVAMGATDKIDLDRKAYVTLVNEALEAFEYAFSDLLNKAKEQGLIDQETFESMLKKNKEFEKVTGRKNYLPRGFSPEGINRILMDKGLSEANLEALIEEASVQYLKKAGDYHVVDGLFVGLIADADKFNAEYTKLKNGKDQIEFERFMDKAKNYNKTIVASAKKGAKKYVETVRRLYNREDMQTQFSSEDYKAIGSAVEKVIQEEIFGNIKNNVLDDARRVLSNNNVIESSDFYKTTLEKIEAVFSQYERAKKDGGKTYKSLDYLSEKLKKELEDVKKNEQQMKAVAWKVTNELIDSLKEKTDKNQLFFIDPVSVQKSILDVTYMFGKNSKTSLASSMLHRAPLDTTVEMEFTNNKGALQTLSVADIYATRNPFKGYESALRSVLGAIELKEAFDIKTHEDVDTLIKMATDPGKEGLVALSPNKQEEVKTFLKMAFNDILGIPNKNDPGQAMASSILSTAASTQFGSYFGITQAGEATSQAIVYNKYWSEALKNKKSNERLDALRTKATHDTYLNRPTLIGLLDIASQREFVNFGVVSKFERPLSDRKFMDNWVDKFSVTVQGQANKFGRANAYLLSNVVLAQRNTLKRTGLNIVIDMANQYNVNRDRAIEGLKTILGDNPSIIEDIKKMSEFSMYTKSIENELKQIMGSDFARAKPAIKKLFMNKNDFYLLTLDLGINKTDLGRMFAIAKQIDEDSMGVNTNKPFSHKDALDLLNSVRDFAEKTLLQSSPADRPYIAKKYPIVALTWTFANYAFSAWNNFSRSVLAHPAYMRNYSRFFAQLVAGQITQMTLLFVGVFIPSLIAGQGIARSMQNFEQEVKKMTLKKTGEPSVFGVDANYVAGSFLRIPMTTLAAFDYRFFTAGSDLPKPEVLRASGLPSKGVFESNPAVSVVFTPIKPVIGATSIAVKQRVNQTDVKEVVLPIANLNMWTKLAAASLTKTDWFEHLPKK